MGAIASGSIEIGRLHALEVADELEHENMMSCKEVTRLVSESMDRRLTLGEWFSLRVHLTMCKLCHGFAVDIDSLQGKCTLTHKHLNDGTCEGIEHAEAKAFSVQYHPEAAAGPHDSRYLFERFAQRIETWR